MSRIADAPTSISRRAWIGLLVGDVVLFVLANITAKNSDHPGALSNLLFVAFVIGLAVIIVLAILATVRSRRRAAR